MKYLFVLFLSCLFSTAYALDSNGNFESEQEWDRFLANTLRDLSQQMNRQAPIMLDENTKFVGTLALNKNLTFMYQIIGIDARYVGNAEKMQFMKEKRDDMNYNACNNESTLALLAVGIVYTYQYSDENGRIIMKLPFGWNDLNCPNFNLKGIKI